MMRIMTAYGNTYRIKANGDFVRTDIPGFKPSGQWKLLGIHHVKMNVFIPFKSLTPARVSRLPLLYKNGHPQYTIVDLDHGTRRVWGNTQVHGIRSITFSARRKTK